jgi:beta-lactamase superfamily II metal-dependent hydrolase
MYEGTTSDDGTANDMSCLLAIRCRGCTILFTGDSSARLITDAWKGYVKTYGCGDRIDIIKMPHHGSRGERSVWPDSKELWQELLNAEALALLSYGQRNRYRHPHHDLLEVLRSSGILTVSTNLCPKCKRRGDTEPDMFCDEEEEVLADRASIEAVELAVDEVGNIKPAFLDMGRQCEFCNSFVVYTATAK